MHRSLHRLALVLAGLALVVALAVGDTLRDSTGALSPGALGLLAAVLALAGGGAVAAWYRRPLWTAATACCLLVLGVAGTAVGPQVLAVGALAVLAALADAVAIHAADTPA
jgi:hypothetical protein